MKRITLIALSGLVGAGLAAALTLSLRPTGPAPAAVAAAVLPAEPPTAPAPTLTTQTIALGARDTLLAALIRHDVDRPTAHSLIEALRDAGARMRQLRPGDMVALLREQGGRVAQASFAPSAWLRYEARAAQGGGWDVQRIEIEPEIRVEARQATIERSLWDAVSSGAMSPQSLLDLARIFESEIDFSADTQPGDRLRLLVEGRYAGGVLIDHGRILAAQYVADDGKVTTAVGFEHDGRLRYYDADGRALAKTFLRSPLEFTRISSGFTHRRPHPVLGGVRPHLAVDYAAPTGTPVWAVADGTVEFAGRKGGNGIQVLLRHKGGYRTYYNHLSRVAPGIRPGVQVRQKDVIGNVGSTGISTGPHLDYRVSRHGVFVNPLSETFIPGEPLSAALRAAFATRAGDLLATLDRQAPL